MSRKKSPDHVGQEPKLEPVFEENPQTGNQTEGGSDQTSPGEAESWRDALERELQAAKAEAAGNYDRFVRAKAETENIRRRAEADIAAVRKFAIEAFAADVLTVRDNLERAQAVDFRTEGVVEKVIEGLALTLKQVDTVLERYGLTPVDPVVGERFDPERHQAMTMIETRDMPPGHVAQVVQKGYLLNGRLLRPAMVIVAKEATET
ncbi:MAG: nucleotide exchange factor GrpE [Acidiferrobacteraceae bacterium]